MKPVGILGGSFDPIHLGHLITSYDVLEKRNLEKIIFVPCHISPHKTDQKPTDNIHRLNMVNLAIEKYPYFESSDFEIRKGDVSYTYNTLVELKKTYDRLELIIGFDNLIVFDKWFRPDDILQLATVVVMKREIDNIPVKHNKYFDSTILLETSLIDISSTEIRVRVKNNETIDYLVPSKVKEYISKHGLYK
ncbi:MAG: nicotinate (nicotinamide) nucleotide adenylyltransferase [Ignavibacteriales bacterium]|nr:MAG: nicotinate (nicotinamide) nucleotide adenylyltransferase [Ignavibacteriales bacterium]